MGTEDLKPANHRSLILRSVPSVEILIVRDSSQGSDFDRTKDN